MPIVENSKTPARTAATARRSPVGPQGSGLFGNAARLQADPLGLYTDAWKKYGDYIRVRAAPNLYFYVLLHPNAVEHVLLKNHKNYRKPDVFNRALNMLAYKGLFTREGREWVQVRRILQPAFHPRHLSNIMTIAVRYAEAFVEEHTRRQEPFDMDAAMMKMSLGIVSTALFSTDISTQGNAVGKAFRTGMAYVGPRMNFPIQVPPWLPTPHNLNFKREKKFMDAALLQMIAQRRKQGGPDDLLTGFLAARDEETGEGLSDQQIKEEMITVLSAGHETTGVSMAFAWYLLGRNPKIQDEVADEARGRLNGRSPTFDDVPHLPLAGAAFQEGLRLYPPAWRLPRETVEPDEVDGLPIPKRTLVVVCPFLTHRHPEFWPDPEKFDPAGRFLSAATVAARPRFAYFPFSGGPRLCVGDKWALAEVALVLATVTQKARLEIVPGQTLTLDPGMTLRPKGGIQVILRPRS